MKPQLVLIAGPYRGGTDGDPARIMENLHRLELAALAVYERGHMPMVGEWVALPLARAAGSERIGDDISERFLYPSARRLIQQCDAVLRIPGESKGADGDVELAHKLGLPVYYGLDDLPEVTIRASVAG
ncbi:DUF4406 domain-containing protein [Paraburkholderia flagellata]|uniref:DUF4406 domain-containing protein n=1 Tax=Paraburkholderia flagellata TaxID=2883241 RepID=UPI001F3174D2|nr:DUF4406 domain-containing protein [Paraburkholderia flagellata]